MNPFGSQVLITGKEDAYRFAEQAFLQRHPDNAELFATAWEMLETQSRQYVGTAATCLAEQLSITGAADEMTLDMVREIGIYFETMMTKFPLVREELINRFRSICKKYEMPKDYVDNGAKHLDAVVMTERQLLVVCGAKTGKITEKEDVPETVARKEYLARREQYDVFVWENKVWVRKALNKNAGHREVPFRQATIRYRIFIMMLRYRGRPLPTRWLYTAAWQPEQASIERLFDKDFSDDLRYAIRDIERKLDITYLYTPDKLEHEDYVCMGEFSFCIVIPMALAKELSMS